MIFKTERGMLDGGERTPRQTVLMNYQVKSGVFSAGLAGKVNLAAIWTQNC
jgi:hypothetical protein